MKEIKNIREFNRFYAKLLCLFTRNALGTDFSIIEARIIGEIGRNSGCTANDISNYLNIDRGYLSRIIDKFEKADIITKTSIEGDRRKKGLWLSQKGEMSYDLLEDKSNELIENMLANLSSKELNKMINAMNQIMEILGADKINDWNI